MAGATSCPEAALRSWDRRRLAPAILADRRARLQTDPPPFSLFSPSPLIRTAPIEAWIKAQIQGPPILLKSVVLIKEIIDFEGLEGGE